jgi:hypothetical protein
VLVPHSDGRAGCGAVVLTPDVTPESMDWVGLAEYLLQRMPRYAVPIWIRVTQALGKFAVPGKPVPANPFQSDSCV